MNTEPWKIFIEPADVNTAAWFRSDSFPAESMLMCVGPQPEPPGPAALKPRRSEPQQERVPHDSLLRCKQGRLWSFLTQNETIIKRLLDTPAELKPLKLMLVLLLSQVNSGNLFETRRPSGLPINDAMNISFTSSKLETTAGATMSARPRPHFHTHNTKLSNLCAIEKLLFVTVNTCPSLFHLSISLSKWSPTVSLQKSSWFT